MILMKGTRMWTSILIWLVASSICSDVLARSYIDGEIQQQLVLGFIPKGPYKRPPELKIPGNSSAYYCDDMYHEDLFVIDRLDIDPYPFDCRKYWDYTVNLTGHFKKFPGENMVAILDAYNDDYHDSHIVQPLCDWVEVLQNSENTCAAPKKLVDTVFYYPFEMEWWWLSPDVNYTARVEFQTQEGQRILCFVGSEVLFTDDDMVDCSY